MRISDWSSDVCASDLRLHHRHRHPQHAAGRARVRLHRLHVPGRPGRARPDGDDLLESGEAADRGLHYRQVWMNRPAGFGIRDWGFARAACPTVLNPITAKSPDARAFPNPQSPIPNPGSERSEEHTSELQSLMRISYAVCCLQQTRTKTTHTHTNMHSAHTE